MSKPVMIEPVENGYVVKWTGAEGRLTAMIFADLHAMFGFLSTHFAPRSMGYGFAPVTQEQMDRFHKAEEQIYKAAFLPDLDPCGIVTVRSPTEGEA